MLAKATWKKSLLLGLGWNDSQARAVVADYRGIVTQYNINIDNVSILLSKTDVSVFFDTETIVRDNVLS
jgi:cellulose synthase/poly-beta-1,6-N-acetylglucosamine synthase-like glycosyltransferase